MSSFRETAPLPASPSVVIVDGGVVGTSAAFHLAEAGVDVVLLERNQLRSDVQGGRQGPRAVSDALNIEIAQRSLVAFRSFAEPRGGTSTSNRSGTCSS